MKSPIAIIINLQYLDILSIYLEMSVFVNLYHFSKIISSSFLINKFGVFDYLFLS